jgi:very-short-patch-repair endonuclease
MKRSDCHASPDNWGSGNNRSPDHVIASIADRQGGVVGRSQLLARGIPAKAIAYRLHVGRLRHVYREVYAVGHDAIPIRGRLVAALLVAGPGAALSHRTAAYVLTLLPSMPPFVEVTTTIRRRSDRPGLVFHHATDLETTHRHGLPITTPIRTLRDLAATRPEHEVERGASEALVLKLIDAADLTAQHGPGSATLASLLGAPTQSSLERAFLTAVLTFGLPRPQTHHRIGRYTVDFSWPSHRLVVETDGAAYHDHPLARRRDARKTDALRAMGYTVIRVPEDALEAGVAATAAALSRASRTAP